MNLQGHEFVEGGHVTDRAPLVVPFRGEHHTSTTQLSNLLSPPYDVLDAAARAVFAGAHPANIVHLILPEGAEATRYGNATAVLADWREREIVERDAQPSVYVVQQQFVTPNGAEFVRSGVIGAVAAEAYDGGRVKPHERTHRGPKEDRLALLRATRVQSEAIFLVARDARGHLRRRLDGVTRHEAHATAELEGVRIRLWRVAGVQAREIAHAAGDTLYIADGHHRYETATTAALTDPSAGRLPALIVPTEDPGLVVLATHRLVRGADINPEQARQTLTARFAVADAPPETSADDLLTAVRGEGVRCVVRVGGHRWICTAPGDGRLPLVAIEEWVVEPLKNLAGGAVHYSPLPAVAMDGEAAAGILVPPTPLQAVLDTADAGGFMPPKSTYFQPKVPSGLVWMPLDD